MKITTTVNKQKRRKKSKDSLPRTRQLEIETKDNDIVVMGIDEAGTGPLAGYVFMPPSQFFFLPNINYHILIIFDLKL